MKSKKEKEIKNAFLGGVPAYKKEKKFVLSERRFALMKNTDLEYWNYYEEDVREFIRQLKEKIKNHKIDYTTSRRRELQSIIYKIDELAGEELK